MCVCVCVRVCVRVCEAVSVYMYTCTCMHAYLEYVTHTHHIVGYGMCVIICVDINLLLTHPYCTSLSHTG